jgi:creatinine amidohydrolase
MPWKRTGVFQLIMTTELPGAFTAHLKWPELERRVDATTTAVLPIAAACKEHGPHLPMQADLLQAKWLAGVLVERANVLVWPTVTYGYYPAFTDYPGSVSLSRETFQRLLQEILSGIQRTGVRTVLILNTGISTIKPLQDVAVTFSKELHITLANVYDGPHYRRQAEAIEEQTCGGHADELETSILLAIDRQTVSLDKAVAWTPATMAASGRFSRDPCNPGFSPAGVWGDPTLASEEKGRLLLAGMVDDLLALIQ